MVRERGEILVEVHCFLVGFGSDPTLFDGNCQVEEVNRSGWLHECPFKDAEVVGIILECLPFDTVGVSNPNSDDIIYESEEKGEMVAILCSVPDCKVDCSPHTC